MKREKVTYLWGRMKRAQLLQIASFYRAPFYKIWNQTLKADSSHLWTWQKRLEFVLLELKVKDLKIELPSYCRFIAMIDRDYPKLLLELPQPPIGIFVWGKFDPENSTSLSIVGSRKPTPYALRMTRKIAGIYSKLGCTIVSGGAYGIDSEAHQGAVEVEGKTWVILGGGFNHLYPKTNADLFRSVVECGGALISEYRPDLAPRNYFFPERNRLIAALGESLVLAQAHEKSGSLSTARAALDLGREVFVLRPPPGDENFLGSLELIQQGAIELTSPEQIVSAYRPDNELQKSTI